MGPFGKLTQHVSYRKPVGLFVGSTSDGPASNFCLHGQRLRALPSKTLGRQQPKIALGGKTHIQIDLFFQDLIKSPESTWESFWPPRDPQEAPRDPQKSPRNLPGTPQETPRETKPISQHVSGVELPIARLWRPVC